MMHPFRGRSLFIALCLLSGAAQAGAATITMVSVFSLPGFSTGSVGPVGLTPDPNNDNVTTANANTIPSSVFLNTFGTMEIEFVLAPSGGTTEYSFTQALVNNTGQTWIDYHFQLGFGIGADFVPSGILDLLDFDTPDMDPSPTSSVFTVLDHQPDTLGWSGGSVPAISSVFFTLAFDVPDGLEAFNPSGENRFTLRQFPTTAAVPEPGIFLLMGAGIVGIVAARRRRAAP